jgi:hypothetical protein
LFAARLRLQRRQATHLGLIGLPALAAPMELALLPPWMILPLVGPLVRQQADLPRLLVTLSQKKAPNRAVPWQTIYTTL